MPRTTTQCRGTDRCANLVARPHAPSCTLPVLGAHRGPVKAAVLPCHAQHAAVSNRCDARPSQRLRARRTSQALRDLFSRCALLPGDFVLHAVICFFGAPSCLLGLLGGSFDIPRSVLAGRGSRGQPGGARALRPPSVRAARRGNTYRGTHAVLQGYAAKPCSCRPERVVSD